MPRFEVRQSRKLLLTSYSGLALIGQCCQAAQPHGHWLGSGNHNWACKLSFSVIAIEHKSHSSRLLDWGAEWKVLVVQLPAVWVLQFTCQSTHWWQMRAYILLFIVGPHAEHFDDVLLLKHFVDQTMLNVDSP